jgi:hypothetical protein
MKTFLPFLFNLIHGCCVAAVGSTASATAGNRSPCQQEDDSDSKQEKQQGLQFQTFLRYDANQEILNF